MARCSIHTFFAACRHPADGTRINAPRAVVALIIVFVLLSTVILSLEHGVGDDEPHLKDEEGYYGWAVLYTNGYWSLPLDRVTGRYRQLAVVSTNPAANELIVDTELGAFDSVNGDDGTDVPNDLAVTVQYPNGTPVIGARVAIRISATQQLENRTNRTGGCILYNVPFGQVQVEVVVLTPGSAPLVRREAIDTIAGAQRGRYTIQVDATLERTTNHTLPTELYVGRPDGTNGTIIPVTEAEVFLNGARVAVTDGNGTAMLHAAAATDSALIGLRGALGDPAGLLVQLGSLEGVTDASGNVAFGVNNSYRLAVRVTDSFGAPLSDVTITQAPLDGAPRALGQTDADGDLETTLELPPGEHRLAAEKTVDGYDPPFLSGIALIDGEYQYVDHWPPGPSVLVAGLLLIGLEDAFGLFLMILLCVSTWGIARRTFDWRVATLATLLVMINGITFQCYFGQWMGDLSSTALAMGGCWVFIAAVDRWRDPGASMERRWPIVGLTLVAGVLLGTAVTMRYSSIVAAVVPFIYLLGITLRDARAQRRAEPSEKDARGSSSRRRTAARSKHTATGRKPERSGFQRLATIRYLVARRQLRSYAVLLIPLVIGLAIIGALLMTYNATYFGGPLNSGYQAKTIQAVLTEGVEDPDGNASLSATTTTNQTLTEYTPSESFFEQYFRWGEDDLRNAPFVLHYLVIFVPLLFLLPAAIVHLRREPLLFALAAWIGLTLLLYLSQGWVLKRVIEDIRYYMPLVAPTAILGAALLVPLARTVHLPRRVTFGTVIAVVVLLCFSTATAGQYTIQSEFREAAGPANPGPGQQLPKEIPVFPIPILYQHIQEVAGREVIVTHCEIDSVISSNLLILRDDRDPSVQLHALCEWTVEGLAVGESVEVRGWVQPDERNPGHWLLRVEAQSDLKILEHADPISGPAPPPIPTTRSQPLGQPDAEAGTEGRSMARTLWTTPLQQQQQQQQPQQPQQQQPGSLPNPNARPKMEEHRGLRDLGRTEPIAIAGLVLFYSLGLAAWVRARRSRQLDPKV